MQIKKQTIKQLNEFLMKIYLIASEEYRKVIDEFFAEQRASTEHKSLEETLNSRTERVMK